MQNTNTKKGKGIQIDKYKLTDKASAALHAKNLFLSRHLYSTSVAKYKYEKNTKKYSTAPPPNKKKPMKRQGLRGTAFISKLYFVTLHYFYSTLQNNYS